MGISFVTADGLALSPKALRGIIKLVLSMAPGAIMLHSLRSDGAQTCTFLGASVQGIKGLGHWLPSVVRAYIPKVVITSAGQTLSFSFG